MCAREGGQKKEIGSGLAGLLCVSGASWALQVLFTSWGLQAFSLGGDVSILRRCLYTGHWGNKVISEQCRRYAGRQSIDFTDSFSNWSRDKEKTRGKVTAEVRVCC